MYKLDNNFLYMSIIKTLSLRLTPTYIMMLRLLQLSSAWFDKTSHFTYTRDRTKRAQSLVEKCSVHKWYLWYQYNDANSFFIKISCN